jgi:bisphosphoglycerate-dependent phosphoglycerate mutase
MLVYLLLESQRFLLLFAIEFSLFFRSDRSVGTQRRTFTRRTRLHIRSCILQCAQARSALGGACARRIEMQRARYAGNAHSTRNRNRNLHTDCVQCWELNERMYGALEGVNRQEAVDIYGLSNVLTWRRSWGDSRMHTCTRTLVVLTRQTLLRRVRTNFKQNTLKTHAMRISMCQTQNHLKS